MSTAPGTSARTRRRPELLVGAWVVGLAACSGEETAPATDEPAPALDVALVVDPNEIAEADLAARLETLAVIVDAAAGLYEPGEESSDGPVQVKNADADASDLELVATLAVPEGRLPTFRIERGGLPDIAVDVRVIGFQGDGAPIAEGTLRGARFGDTPEEVQLPFRLRASELPPRVVDALPADGSSLVGCSLPSLVVVFSRPVDGDSLASEGAVSIEPAGAPGLAPSSVALDPSGFVATFGTEGVTGSDGLALRLTVSSVVRAAAGGPELDQVPAEAGLQPFGVDLTFVCTPKPVLPCEVEGDPGCPELCGEVVCPEDPRVACVDDGCVLTSCASCSAGEVCDTSRGLCAVDCRTASAIDGCDPDVPCDPATGLCAR